MPSIRSARVGSAVAAALAALSVVGLAAAQPSVGSELDLGVRLAARFGVAVVVNLLLGGVLLAVAPEYARATVDAIHDDPGTAFVWGLIVGVGVPIAMALLAITIVGLLIAVPGLIAVAIVGVVGNAVTICWVGTLLTDDSLDGTTVAIGAVAMALLVAVPVLGDFVSALLGFFGLGAVGHDIYTSWRG